MTWLPKRLRAVAAIVTMLACCVIGSPASAVAPPPEATSPTDGTSAESSSATAARDGAATPEHGDPAAEHSDSKGDAKQAGAHKGEAHDPFDLTHANATSELVTPRELRFDHLIGSWIVFLLLLAIVGKLGWKPIMNGLRKREEAITAKIDEAARSAELAAERLREYEAKLAAVAGEARVMLAQAQQDAEKSAARIVTEAEQAAQRERARAIAEINAARSSALDDITTRSVDLAVLMANRIVQRQLTAADHKKLISEVLDQFTHRN